MRTFITKSSELGNAMMICSIVIFINVLQVCHY